MNTNEFARILLTWIKSFLSWIGIPRDRLNELDEIIFLILIVVIAFAVGAVFHYLSVRFTRKVLKYSSYSKSNNYNQDQENNLIQFIQPIARDAYP